MITQKNKLSFIFLEQLNRNTGLYPLQIHRSLLQYHLLRKSIYSTISSLANPSIWFHFRVVNQMNQFFFH
jgi:hypothetical protein